MNISALTAHDREAVVTALEASEMRDRRSNHGDGIAFLIEEAIYRQSTTHEEYTASVIRFMLALTHNMARVMSLIGKTSADNVVGMDDNTILHGTGVVRAQHRFDDREHRFKSMLQEKFEELTDNAHHDQDEGLLQCKRCQSTNVMWDQRQTRSADEGMTIIAQCLACSNTWIMS